MSNDSALPAGGRSRRLRLARWRFGGMVFDPQSRDLRLPRGQITRLPPKVARLLELLVERRGTVVTRGELRRDLWGDRFVDHEQGLNFLISQTRRALGDDASSPRFIETVRGTGYRFIAPARPVDLDEADLGLTASSARRCRSLRVGALRLGVALLVLVAMTLGPADSVDRDRLAGDAKQRPSSSAFDRAHDLYLEGRFLEALDEVDDLRKALARYRAALALEPDLAEAHAAVGMVWQKLGLRGAEPVSVALVAARGAAHSALEIAQQTPRAHLVLGIVHLYLDLDPVAARRTLERAVATTPSSGEARLWLARAVAAGGDPERAIDEVERALRVEPGSPRILPDRAWFYYLAGRYERAAAAARRALDVEPDSWAALQSLHLSYVALGRIGAARQVASRLARLLGSSGAAGAEAYRSEPVPEVARGLVELAELLERSCDSLVLERARLLALAGETDSAIELVRRGIELRLWWSPYVGVDPAFGRLQHDPRFRRVVRSIPPADRRV